MASPDTINTLGQALSSTFNNAVGDPLLAVLALLSFFVILMFVLGLPAEAMFLIIIPLIVVLATSGLPSWTLPLVLAGAAVIVAIALLRIFRR